MKNLNFFRKNDLGYTICQIEYDKGYMILPFVYNDYLVFTTNLFLNEIYNLENSSLCPRVYNTTLSTIFTNYFSILEQFISKINVVTYHYYQTKILPDEKKAIKLFRQDYIKSLSDIFERINVDNIELKKAQFYNKIREAEDIRNSILHGNIGKVKIKHTQFPEIPLSINVEDILEIISILIDLFNHLRYIIPNLDLMPSVKIIIDKAVFFKKLDDYFFNILIPYFDKVLKKQNLIISKTYGISTNPLNPVQSLIAKNVSILYKAVVRPEYEIKMNDAKTNLYNECVLKNYSPKEIWEHQEMFQLPAFNIV